MLHVVVMAGGAGTRFWPASRADRPKQLLRLAGERSMIQATLDRLGPLAAAERTLVVTSERLVAAMREQLPNLPPSAIIGEPCKRDTAPCVGLAAAITLKQDGDATMLVCPADHVITPDVAFQAAVRQAAGIVDEYPGRIVTFGVRPTCPAESFGYIERAAALPARGEAAGQAAAPVYRVGRFREKPKAKVAAEYLASGDFYWNSGIFVWKAATILGALKQREPEMAAHCEAIAAAYGASEFDEVFRREFEAIRGKSIDYAVMESYDDVAVIEAPFAWDDVGSWTSLSRLRDADEAGNTLAARRHAVLESRNCIVYGEGDHLVALLGVEDLIVVHTGNATLVAHRSQEEKVRRIVAEIREKGWEDLL